MPTYKVTYEDGRTMRVLAPGPDEAKKHADGTDLSRFVSLVRRGLPPEPAPSKAVDAVEIKKGIDY
jgi:hypothetical protein